MLGELITLPLRVGIRATQLSLRAAEETVALVATATGRLIDTAVSRKHARAEPREPKHVPALEPERDPRPVNDGARITSETPEPTEAETLEPVHVSEEPELVEQTADPGAEDGAGASVHVREPWDGYRQMKADDVIDKLSGASPAELAAIQLYEDENKGRTTVLQEVERELRISTSSGSQS